VGIPDLDLIIASDGHQPAAIWAEGDGTDAKAMRVDAADIGPMDHHIAISIRPQPKRRRPTPSSGGDGQRQDTAQGMTTNHDSTPFNR
jgi:hypothetical protein